MSPTMPQEPFYTTLPHRGGLRLRGAERLDFLQALITNDIRHLTAEAPLYACLLTPQGKFLHDFFIIAADERTTILDCEGGARTADLLERLKRYCLRKQVEITAEDSVPVYAIFGAPHSLPDPRHPAMGSRSFIKPEGLREEPFAVWDRQRITLGIPDGSRDLVIGQSTLDEGRIEHFHGVSYEKGCYVGQELTARMHYRGLGKKYLEPVMASDLPEGAELRSTCGDIGLALVRA